MKTITLPAGTLHLQIDELAHHMALSLYPLRYDDSPGDGLSYAFCCETFKAELTQAVESKVLPVRDPLTFGLHAHPYGANVQHALVRVDDLRKYVADRGLFVEVHDSEVPAQSLAMVESVAVVVEVPPNEPRHAANWTLTKPKRFQGYNEPLYLLLEAAHNAAQSLPTAREILQTWAKNQPDQIANVIQGDSLDYYLADGGTKPANLKAITAAITGMTGKSQD